MSVLLLPAIARLDSKLCIGTIANDNGFHELRDSDDPAQGSETDKQTKRQPGTQPDIQTESHVSGSVALLARRTVAGLQSPAAAADCHAQCRLRLA